MNAGVFTLMSQYLPKFSLSGGFEKTVLVALVFTLLNFILKPIFKLILGPLIILTLGLGLILVNMLLLYILDSLANNLNIDGVLTIFYAAIILGIANFLIHLFFKKRT